MPDIFRFAGRWLGAIACAMALYGAEVNAASPPDITVWKSPACDCCANWVEHLRANGFKVTVEEREDLAPVKTSLGVPAALHGCHSAKVGGYAVEGHVPAADIHRLLERRPAATGLAVPGMPVGSPGMEADAPGERYQVVLFGPSGYSIWATH